MSASLDFRKCKRLLLSSLAVVLATQGFTPQVARCIASCKIPVSEHRERDSLLSFAKQTAWHTFMHCKRLRPYTKKDALRLFLTLSFESLSLSTVKQNGQANMLVRFVGGEKGIR